MFTPTAEDVARYRGLRTLGTALNSRLVKTIPRQAAMDIGAVLGLMVDGHLYVEDEWMSAVFADCCLYEWYEDDENLIERFAKAEGEQLTGDEKYLLDAYLSAEFRILAERERVRGAGIQCLDVVNGDELFLMDLAMGEGGIPLHGALATRTIPLGDYWMTSGAALPVGSVTTFQAELQRLSAETPPEYQKSDGLTVVRACLGKRTPVQAKKRRNEPKHQWRRK